MRPVLASLCLVLSACGVDRADWPEVDASGLGLEVRVAAASVGLGEPFELEVRRRHPLGLVPAAFDPAGLAPLDLEPVGSTRTTSGDEVLEVLRYRARAWALDRVQVPPVVLLAVPPTGGDPLARSSLGFELSVRRALDPEAPGELERPDDPLPLAAPPAAWRAPLLAASLLGLVAAWTMRRRRGGPTREHDPRRAHEPAHADLRALGRLLQGTPVPQRSWYAALAAVLRAYLELRFELPARARTRPELLRDGRLAERLDDAQRGQLDGLLAACDGVLYGGEPTDGAHARELLRRSVELVESTRAGARPAPVRRMGAAS